MHDGTYLASLSVAICSTMACRVSTIHHQVFGDTVNQNKAAMATTLVEENCRLQWDVFACFLK